MLNKSRWKLILPLEIVQVLFESQATVAVELGPNPHQNIGFKYMIVPSLRQTAKFDSYIAWRKHYESSPEFRSDPYKKATTGTWTHHVQLVPHGKKNKSASVSFADVALTMAEAQLKMSRLYREELPED